MSSRPPRDGQYQPAVSSPLNPTCPQDPSRQQRRCGRSRASFRKPSGPVSPSQRLMRQQAEAAWRSLASKRPAQVVQSATVETVTRSAARPAVVQIERRQSIAGPEEAAVKKEAEPPAEHRGRPTLFIDTTDRQQMVLGILVEDDLEKQQLGPCSDFGTIKRSWLHHVLPAALEHRIRGATIMTQQRMLLTVSILCVMAILSAFFSHQ
ncbi:hypothetical protein KJ359_003456 [Pestalotiopsis sp. 9143b]|nr:hypothetical protein KJ359_003456 [Pestalotiopsis sp. 9143b]